MAQKGMSWDSRAGVGTPLLRLGTKDGPRRSNALPAADAGGFFSACAAYAPPKKNEELARRHKTTFHEQIKEVHQFAGAIKTGSATYADWCNIKPKVVGGCLRRPAGTSTPRQTSGGGPGAGYTSGAAATHYARKGRGGRMRGGGRTGQAGRGGRTEQARRGGSILTAACGNFSRNG